MIEAALTVDPDPAPENPSLALSEDKQRRLLETVDWLADGMLAEAGRGQGAIARLRQSVELVLGETLRGIVRQGREAEILPLLIEVFGEEHGSEVERRFRTWMERGPPAG